MSFLIVMGMEGIFCALMAAPLAMAAIIVAGLLVHVAKIIFKNDEFNSCKHLSTLLLLSHCSSLRSTRLRNRGVPARPRSPSRTASASRPRPTGSGRRLAGSNRWMEPSRSCCNSACCRCRAAARSRGRAKAVSEPVILTRAPSRRRSPRCKSQAGWNSKSPATPCWETNG